MTNDESRYLGTQVLRHSGLSNRVLSNWVPEGLRPSSFHRVAWHTVFAVCVATLAATAASAATPRDELLRLVPEDVGFCLVLEDLRGHGTALLESPFVRQFRSSPLGAKVIAAPETQKLSALDDFLQGSLRVSSAQVRDDILGDAVVLAYRPGPPGKPEQEQGLILLRARDAKLLANLIDRLNQIQKDTGQLKELEDREYRGRKYHRRVESATANFYYLRGPVLAFAPHEEILHELIDLDVKAAAEGEPAVARQFRLLGVDKHLAALWVNPRAFDSQLQRKADEARGAPAVALKTLLVYWKALEGVAFSVALQKDVEVSVAIRAQMAELPAAARRFLSTASGPSELWSHFPENAMLAVASRVDVWALVEVLSGFMAEDSRKSFRGMLQAVGAMLGKDIAKELLPQVGPDWGFCVVAPPAKDKAWFPHSLAVLRVRPGESGVPADRTLLSALNFAAMLAVLSHNKEAPGRLSLKTAIQDKVEVKYLVNDDQFPPGLRPAFALKDGFLVLASSPEAIRRFSANTNATHARSSDVEVPLLRLSLRQVSAYLKERREALIPFVAEKHQLSKVEAGQRLDSLVLGLELFDRVEISQQAAPGRATLRLRVQLTQPLK